MKLISIELKHWNLKTGISVESAATSIFYSSEHCSISDLYIIYVLPGISQIIQPIDIAAILRIHRNITNLAV